MSGLDNPREAIMTVWQQVQQMMGRTLRTGSKGKEFTIDVVQDDYLVVKPRAGDPRLVLRQMIDRVAGLGPSRDDLTLARLKEAFPKNRNLSYILAIIQAVA